MSVFLSGASAGNRFAIPPQSVTFVEMDLDLAIESAGWDRGGLSRVLIRLAEAGVYVGTSSWKYPGWLGQVYDRDRYVRRGRFSSQRFRSSCLEEYATLFPTVSVDAAYYRLPLRKQLLEWAGQAPGKFLFGFKVTDVFTLRTFPRLARFGALAGQQNDDFLNARLFRDAFLQPLGAIRDRVGVLMLEFSRFFPRDSVRGRDFVESLDRFFREVPEGWPYAVEIRNREFLRQEYFDVLARHGVAHVYNSWDAMPSIAEQWRVWGGHSPNGLVVGRFLLRPGRQYAEAVKTFEPYNKIKDPYEKGREAGAAMIRQGRSAGASKRTFIFVNNRLEGNAPRTIQAMLAESGERVG